MDIISPFFDQLLHVGRNFRIERQPFACDGMFEAQGFGMKRLTWTDPEAIIDKLFVFSESGAFQYFVSAIFFVVKKRMPDVFEMNADLMGAPGFQPQADERAVSGGLLDAVMRHGALAAGADRALCARAEAGNRRVDDAFGLRGNAFGHGEIFADEAVRVQLAGQQALGVGMAGDAEQAARALIQPVDGVIIKRRRVLTEQNGKLFAERAGVDVAAGSVASGAPLLTKIISSSM